MRTYKPYPYPLRWRLPYGKWKCEDGRTVIFDRVYDPIAQKYPGQPASFLNPERWIYDITDQTWLYDDATPEYLKDRRAREQLRDWGIYDDAIARAKELRKIPHKMARTNTPN